MREFHQYTRKMGRYLNWLETGNFKEQYSKRGTRTVSDISFCWIVRRIDRTKKKKFTLALFLWDTLENLSRIFHSKCIIRKLDAVLVVLNTRRFMKHYYVKMKITKYHFRACGVTHVNVDIKGTFCRSININYFFVLRID